MKTRTTLLLVGVFAALLAYVYFGELRRPAPSAATPTPAALWSVTRDDVVGLQVTGGDRETRLVRDADGAWALQAPVADAADEERVSQLLGRLAGITPSRTFTESVGSLEDYGLDQPDLVVVLSLADGRSETLRVGAANPQQTAYYAQVEGSEPVYLISSWIVTSLRELLDQPPVRPTPVPEPTQTPAPTATPAGQ